MKSSNITLVNITSIHQITHYIHATHQTCIHAVGGVALTSCPTCVNHPSLLAHQQSPIPVFQTGCKVRKPYIYHVHAVLVINQSLCMIRAICPSRLMHLVGLLSVTLMNVNRNLIGYVG